jgi:hypothetical protein
MPFAPHPRSFEQREIQNSTDSIEVSVAKYRKKSGNAEGPENGIGVSALRKLQDCLR